MKLLLLVDIAFFRDTLDEVASIGSRSLYWTRK